MIRLLLCILIIFSWNVDSAQGEATRFRGNTAISRLLRERMLTEGSSFSFSPYMYDPNDSSSFVPAFSLLGLLGDYSSSGNNEFRNGTPNSVNMLVWQLVLSLTAQEMSKYCSRSSTLPFHPAFAATLDPLCGWPSADAKSEKNLENFWIAVMGYDAPETEFLAWRDFALRSSFSEKSASETLPALFFAIVYNPHFLLRK